MRTHKTSDVQIIFGKSSETIRQWAIEFRDYLSPGATPGQGRRRIFTEEDLKVFALINEMLKSGSRYGDIGASLFNGARGAIPEAANGHELTIPSTPQYRALAARSEQWQIERDTARAELKRAKEEVIRLQTHVDILTGVSDKLESATERIGYLTARLEMLAEEKQKKEGGGKE